MQTLFKCPTDGLILNKNAKTLSCINNHCFDYAKEGYINLLLSSQKNSKEPGDSKEMILARKLFLSSSAYKPIAETLAKLVVMTNPDNENLILDAGCGEGYYLSQLSKLRASNPNNLYGIDISKDAIKSAAKSYKDINWAVASNANLPFPDSSFATIISMFGFPVSEEFNRVLTDKGMLITVNPAKNHLIEIRKIIYPEIKTKNKTDKILENNNFKLIRNENLTYAVNLNKEQIRNLMLMTPHFFRATLERKNDLLKLSEISTTIDVSLSIYNKI